VLLDELAGEPLLRGYHPYAVARADLLHRAGRHAEAVVAYRKALDLAGTAPERNLLRRRLHMLEQADTSVGSQQR